MTSRSDGHHVYVKGAEIVRSKIGGSVQAGVNVSVGSDRMTLPSAVEQLVHALQGEGMLSDPELARLVGRLEAAADGPEPEPGPVRRIIDQIEGHPALAEAIPSAVAAALQAIQLAIS